MSQNQPIGELPLLREATRRYRDTAHEPAVAVECLVGSRDWRISVRARCACVRHAGAMRGHRRRGQSVLCRTRLARDARQSPPVVLPGIVCTLRAPDAGHPAPPGSGHRSRARYCNRCRVPIGRQLRFGNRRRLRAICRLRHQRRPFLLDPVGGIVAQYLLEACVRHAGYRPVHRCGHCIGLRTR